jgi:hypothetical protein
MPDRQDGSMGTQGGHRIGRTVALALVLAGSALLTGCSPPQLPLVAARVTAEGDPELLLRACKGVTYEGDLKISDLTRYRGIDLIATPHASVPPPAPGAPGPDITLSFPSGSKGAQTVRPFRPPTGWVVKESPADRTLTPEHDYYVTFRQSDATTGIVSFTPEDLATLRPGEVWADNRAMTEAEFTGLATRKC